MIKIGICDDNENDRAALADLCRRFFGTKEDYEIYSYRSGTDYINSSSKPKIMYLYIEM